MSAKKMLVRPPVLPQTIERRILLIRGKKIILDHDLAKLYLVETKQLKRAVKRNLTRFPEDFMFELTKEEYKNLRYHFDTSSWGGRRHLPYAFTEQGVAMLSSVLNSERAVQVNIEIMRTFTRIREMLGAHKDLKQKIDQMEKKYDQQFRVVFEAIKQLLAPPKSSKEPIGFRPVR